MNQKVPARFSLPKALFLIALSLLLISGSSSLALYYFNAFKKKQRKDPRYDILFLAHSCNAGEPLKSSLLAELLDLSSDKPQNLYALFEIFLALIALLSDHSTAANFTVQGIDLSRAFLLSHGKKEIVLSLTEKVDEVIDGKPKVRFQIFLLRLSPIHYAQQLTDFFTLRERSPHTLFSSPTAIVDMRIKNIAFITPHR